MDRLTTEHWRNLDPWECCGQDNHCKRGCHDEGGCNNGCIVPKNYRSLAAYEDTGLTPEEIKAMVKVHNDMADRIEALTADKDEQAGKLMRHGRGIKVAMKMLDDVRNNESGHYVANRSAYNVLNALLGGAGNETNPV